jgi:hypothetical protein
LVFCFVHASTGERFALDEFNDQRRHAAGLRESADGADVGVIEGGEQARFGVEPRQSAGVSKIFES